MNHLKMHSLNKIDENVSKIAQLFPNCVTEAKDENGEITHKIDFDMLKQELSTSIVEGREERYQFTWPDKKQAILTANAPINKTLRPCREESVNFDTTENLYIEGDNLDVLKLLQETYLGKIKMIYIDPPYNTGNDFVYEDDFAQDASDYIANSGQTDEEGNRLVANTENNGRFHTDWLNMMYPRLKLARDLLTDDGVIFISIDDNEVENLKKLCSEIFGEKNFITLLVWEKKKKGAFLSKHYINMKEYIFVYAKKADIFAGLIGEINEDIETYPCIKTTNARGIRLIRKGTISKYREQNYSIEAGTRISSGNMELIFVDKLEVIDSQTKSDVRIDSNWIYGQEKIDEFSRKGELYITQDNYIRRIVKEPRTKMLKDLLNRVGSDGKSLSEFIYDQNLNNGGWGTNEDGNEELHSLLNKQYLFDYAKPSRLISKLIQTVNDDDFYVMDFFSGSGTTAQSVMQLNLADNRKRKFILVQLPELYEQDSDSYKEGFSNICELAKTRIRNAGNKLFEMSKLENKNLDIGFRVLKCDTSNMEDIYYSPEDLHKQDLFKDNVKPDRTAEDLLFQVMLDLGVELSCKITTKEINGKTVYYVNENYLVACFDQDLTEETITQIAKEKPYYFVMRDSGFASDSVSTNFEQIFTTYSPDTVRKVL